MLDFITKPPPLVICSTKGKCFPVLMASIAAYVPENVEIYWAATNPIPVTDTRHKWHILPNTASNFGDAYNGAIQAALDDGHSSVIIANDDVVLNPTSYLAMIEDVATLYREGYRVGIVGARSDCVLPDQNIRVSMPGDRLVKHRWNSEYSLIKKVEVGVVSPIFAWISAKAFALCPFPPLTMFTDDVQCYDLTVHNFENFVSRSYVHHVGSATTGVFEPWCALDFPWVQQHRPALAHRIETHTDVLQIIAASGNNETPQKLVSKLISLCMIVKNEEQYLPRALANLVGFYDELIIVDTGSTDHTVDIALAHGATVLHHDWQEPANESEARNMGLDAATGEWIVKLDADEIICEPLQLRQWLAELSPHITCVWPLYKNYKDGEFLGQWHHGIIFRRGERRYKYRCHPIAFPVDPASDWLEKHRSINFVVEHLQPGNRDKSKKRDFLPRIMADVEENPTDFRPAYNLQCHYLWIEEWHKSIEWGKRTLELLPQDRRQEYEPAIHSRMAKAAESLIVEHS